jgi:hypothetical protein
MERRGLAGAAPAPLRLAALAANVSPPARPQADSESRCQSDASAASQRITVLTETVTHGVTPESR